MKPGPGAPGSEATAGGAGPGKVLFLYMAISLLFNRYCIVSFKFPPRRPSPQAPNRFLVQSLARFGLQNGFWCNPWHVSGFKTVFGAILGTFRASKRFLVQSLARFGLQNGFWCNPWRVLGFKTVFGAILGEFWASKRFLVQSSARFGLQNGFWCNPWHVSGSQTVFGAILGTFWASKRFLVQNEGRRGLKFHFWPNPRLILSFRLHFGVKRAEFLGFKLIFGHVPGRLPSLGRGRRRPQTPPPRPQAPGKPSSGHP